MDGRREAARHGCCMDLVQHKLRQDARRDWWVEAVVAEVCNVVDHRMFVEQRKVDSIY